MFYDIDTRSEQPPNVLNLLEDIVASLHEEGGDDAVETSGLKNIERQKLKNTCSATTLIKTLRRCNGDTITHRPTVHRHDNLSTDNSPTVHKI